MDGLCGQEVEGRNWGNDGRRGIEKGALVKWKVYEWNLVEMNGK